MNALDTPLIYRQIGTPSKRPSSRREMLTAYAEMLPTLNVRADLTLRQAIVRSPKGAPKTYQRLRIDQDIIATVVRAMNRLNHYVWTSHRKNHRLTAFCTWERGKLDRRAHVHALLERPAHVTFDEFKASIQRAWTAQPFGYGVMQIEPLDSLARSLDYNTKQGFDHVIYIHRDDPREQNG